MALRLLMTTDAVGGVWTYASDLAAGLARLGVHTALAVLGPPVTPAQAEAARGAGVTLIETGLPLDWLADEAATRHAAGELAALATRLGVDLIHLNSPALAAATAWPVPVIGVAHGCVAAWWHAVRPGVPLAPEFAWHAAMMAAGLAACARVIAPTRAFASDLAEVYDLPRGPAVVHNGRAWAAAPPADRPASLVLTAGRLWDDAKDTPLLDEVAGLIEWPVLAAGPLIGPQGQRATVTRLTALGPLGAEDLAARLRWQPIFVSAARFEPFGLAVLEAAASGCALVLSDIPTFRELWDGAALFAPPGDANAFARAIGELAQAPGVRSAWGERARSRAADYGLAPMVEAMRGHYHAVLAKDAAPREPRECAA